MQICSAHKLNIPHDSQYKGIHGHNWNITVEIDSDDLNQDGMIVDFKHIKEIVKQLDHTDINSVMEKNPTAECIAQWIAGRIQTLLQDKNKCSDTARLYRIAVQETEDTTVYYTPHHK